MSEATIKVKSLIKQKGEQDHNVEITTPGKIYKKDGSIYIFYEESELSGMEGIKTMLKISDSYVKLSRTGAAESGLIFETGVNHLSKYGTPYGEFMMETTTKSIKLDLDEKLVGSVTIEYHLSIKGLSETEHLLEIKVLNVHEE